MINCSRAPTIVFYGFVFASPPYYILVVAFRINDKTFFIDCILNYFLFYYQFHPSLTFHLLLIFIINIYHFLVFSHLFDLFFIKKSEGLNELNYFKNWS